MKIITGGQSGADLSGNYFANKYGIDTEINTFHGFKPITDELPNNEKIKINFLNLGGRDYSDNLRKRTEYNVKNSDFTIILLDRSIKDTVGSKLTLELCKKHNKSCYYVNIYTEEGVICTSSGETTLGFQVDFAKRHLKFTDKSILNIAGQRTLDRVDCIKFLEKLMSSYINTEK